MEKKSFPSNRKVAERSEANNESFPSNRGVAERSEVGVFIKYKSLPYNPNLKEKAKELRKAGNLAEVIFWNEVKNKKFLKLDFHRQKIIGNYIVDFYCPELDLVVEIDDKSHDYKGEYDYIRENYLKSFDLEIIHFKDSDIRYNLSRIMDDFYKYCECKINTPSR